MATAYASNLVYLQEEITNILEKGEIDSSGGDCQFIDMKNGWGIKCYDLRNARNVSYVCQRAAAELGMAPKARKKFNITDQIHGDEWFCHLTEVVETITGYGIDNSQSQPSMLYEERERWCDDFEKITGFRYEDNLSANFGIKDGELVCIDWDKCYNWYSHLTGKEIQWLR